MVASEFPGSGAHAAPELQAVVITGTKPEALRKIIDILAKYDVPEPKRPPAPEPTFTIYHHLPGPPHHPTNRIRLQPNATLSSKRGSVRLHTSTTAYTMSGSSHVDLRNRKHDPGAQFNRAPYSYTLGRAGGWFLESVGKKVQAPGFKFEVKVL
jgi:hypothetical protein